MPDETIALYAMGGVLRSVTKAVLDGAAPEDAYIHHAEGALRLLGLDRDAAHEVARRPPPRSPHPFHEGGLTTATPSIR